MQSAIAAAILGLNSEISEIVGNSLGGIGVLFGSLVALGYLIALVQSKVGRRA